MTDFTWAPFVFLFLVGFFIVAICGTYFGQWLLQLPETGKDSLILFSAERTFKSLNYCADYFLCFTRFVSFMYMLIIPVVYGSLIAANGYTIWYSFRLWLCALVTFYFFLVTINSVIGLSLSPKNRCCLASSKASGYQYYAAFLQFFFTVAGATSLFVLVIMFWFYDDTLGLLNISFSLAPAFCMIWEMFLSKFYVRFNYFWCNLLFLFTYIIVIWLCAYFNKLAFFPYRALSLQTVTSIRNYFVIFGLNYVLYAVWYWMSELKVLIHNGIDTRLHSAFVDDSEHDDDYHDHDDLLITREDSKTNSVV